MNLIEKFSNLFVNDESDENKTTSILLIDASGSVKMDFDVSNTIFDKFLEIIKKFPQQEHRFIFWNSNAGSAFEFFNNGLYIIPFVVKGESQLNQLFRLVKEKINNSCLTYPHLAFSNIPSEWIAPNKNIIIRLITDGQIGWNNCNIVEQLKNQTQNAMKELFSSHKNVQLEIIAVESISRDFGRIEGLSVAAGCDIYDVILKGSLTKRIKRFTSYTPNNQQGFSHIENRVPRAGFIPFGEKDFSVLNLSKFATYVFELIKNNKDDENELLKIVQNLSHTLLILTEDKPENIKRKNIMLFSDMFNGTVLDTMIVNMLLNGSVEKEKQGKAELFANYRANMKNLYKQASELLLKNVKDATGVVDNIMTLPFKDIPIIHASSQLVDSNIIVQKKTYINAGVNIGGILVPVLPVIRENMPLLNQQCIRQWTRSIISNIYNVDQMGDIVIHTVLGIVLRIVLSRLPSSVKTNFQRLGLIMLNKKRLNVDKTEYENILEGNLPLPNNGIVTNFLSDMEKVKHQLNVNVEPLTLWYVMCLALNDKKLADAQIMHCYDSIKKDFPNHELKDILEVFKTRCNCKVEYLSIPFEASLEYICPITLEDTSNSGGWICSAHQNTAGSVCKPSFVMSESGYQRFIANNNTRMCPYCYTFLSIDEILPVDKKVELSTIANFEKSNDIFKNNTSVAPISNSSRNETSNTLNVQGNNFLLIMKGTVGAGKTTLSHKLKEKIEEMGGLCCVEGMDQHRILGMSPQDATKTIKDNLLNAMQSNNNTKVIIIDTCGDSNGSDIFGVSFPKNNWKYINVTPNYINNENEKYLAWTLRNVLSRSTPTQDSNYYLEPTSAGVDVCVQVHSKKAKNVFGKKNGSMLTVSGHSREDIISEINDRADVYQTKLNETMTMESQINSIIHEKMKL